MLHKLYKQQIQYHMIGMVHKTNYIVITIFIGRDTGGTGGLEPTHFANSGHGPPPTLQRRQLYMWVGHSQYSVKFVSKYDERKNYFSNFLDS